LGRERGSAGDRRGIIEGNGVVKMTEVCYILVKNIIMKPAILCN
jgi:hypothetical protein